MINKISAKEKINKAFVELIRDENVSEITVTELIKKADIGKSTFYRYYKDIFDVFENLADGFVRRCVRTMIELIIN